MSGGPKILTAVELMALELPEPRWAVPEIIPEGLTIFAGRPKMGKSWAALGMAIAVASGGCALGRIQVQGGDVLYLALEDSPKRLQQRLGVMLGQQAPPERLHLTREWPRADKGGVVHLTNWLREHLETRLVVIDTFGRFWPERKERGYDQDQQDGAQLQQLAVHFQVAIVVVHHVRKLGSDDWIDQVSGTLGLAGAADGLLGLFRARGESQAVLKITGRDVEEQELGLAFSPHAGSWTLEGPAAETVELSQERREVLDLLSRVSHPAGSRELADRLGKGHEATRKLLQRIREEGLVISTRQGWSLARARAHAQEQKVSQVSHPTHGTAGTPGTGGTPETLKTVETDGTLSYEDRQAELLSLAELVDQQEREDDEGSLSLDVMSL